MSSSGGAAAFVLVAGPVILFTASCLVACTLATISLRVRRGTFELGRFMLSAFLWWIAVVLVGAIGLVAVAVTGFSALIGSGCVNC